MPAGNTGKKVQYNLVGDFLKICTIYVSSPSSSSSSSSSSSLSQSVENPNFAIILQNT